MRKFLARSFDNSGSTLIELIMMMTMLALGITAMLGVIGSGMDFAKLTEDNIKAINLAREGIEGTTNWRDTNWLRFSSDKKNCWKTFNYDGTCIGNDSFLGFLSTGSYIPVIQNGVWNLYSQTTFPSFNWNTDWTNYAGKYVTWIDSNGYFAQTGATVPTSYCSSQTQTGCLTIFTREIQVSIPAPGTDTGVLNIASIVRWRGKGNHEVRLDTTLTNWKSKF